MKKPALPENCRFFSVRWPCAAAQDYPTLMFFSLGRLILAVFNDLQAVRARNMRVIR